ncbi:hypothetical protein [Microbacterium sp. NPDC076911]|uniref:hypothetical protein n=1 Tax=Microbacterium sp. NPDC076911 TaxID=3154958 RepID=UPI0034432D14
MTDDNPSGELDADAEVVPDDSEEAVASPQRRRLVLFIGGGVLIVVGLVLGIWAFLPGPSEPVADATPSATPSETFEATPTATASVAPQPTATSADEDPDEGPSASAEPAEPDAAKAVINSFTVSPEIAICSDDRSSTVPLTFTWSTADADKAWIAEGTNNASAQPFDEVSLNSSGYTGLSYECYAEEQLFTLTVRGEAGNTSVSVSVVRQLG